MKKSFYLAAAFWGFSLANVVGFFALAAEARQPPARGEMKALIAKSYKAIA